MVAADTMNLAYTSSICYLNFLTSMSIPKHNRNTTLNTMSIMSTYYPSIGLLVNKYKFIKATKITAKNLDFETISMTNFRKIFTYSAQMCRTGHLHIA